VKKYLAILFLFAGTQSVMAQADTLHRKPWRRDTTPDGRPWWSNNDTTKFTPTGYLAASLGVVDAIYASKDPSISLSAAIPLKHTPFGIAGKLGYNSMHEDGSTSNFTQYYLTVGGFFTFQLNTRYAFDVRLLGGLMYCHYPEQNYTANGSIINTANYDSSVNYTITVKSANAFSFVFQGGIGFRYRLSPRLGVLLNIDYMLLRPVFNSTITTTYTGASVEHYSGSSATPTSVANYTFDPPISSTMIDSFEPPAPSGYTTFSLGITYQLGNAILIK
jgi:hypothetical protein